MNFISLILEKLLKPTNSSFIRFLLVGVVNTFVGLLIMFVLLNGAGFSYWASTFTGNTIGAGVSFLMNRRFTFRSNITVYRGLPRFLAMIFLCYFCSYFVSEQLMSQFILPSPTLKKNASVLLGSGLYTISNYAGQKYFVFKKMSPV